MKLEYLREFVVLSSSGTFHAGAKKLFVSCSTLSNHMRALELELGFKLFDRQSGNELTRSGRNFLKAATLSLEIIDTALEKCEKVARTKESADEVVAISLRNSLEELCPLLETFCPCKYTYVEHSLKRPLLYAFAQGDADVMVTYGVDILPELRTEVLDLGLCYEPYGTVPCSIVVEKTSPLVEGPLTYDRLRGFEVVQLDAVESDIWKMMISYMLGADLGLKFRLVPIGTMMNFRLVDLEGAIFVSLSEMIDIFFTQRNDLVVRDCVDGKPLLLPRSLVYRPIEEKPNIAIVLATFRRYLAGGFG